MRLFFTGDVFCKDVKDRPIFDREITAFVQGHDLACLNYEGPSFVDSKNEAVKIGPTIANDDRMIARCSQAGFKLFCLANNHIMDYGSEALAKTAAAISECGADHTGAALNEEAVYRYYRYEKDDISLGIINVAENGFGCSQNTPDGSGYAYMLDNRVKDMIVKAKKECAYVILICHAGAEGFEYPLPEFKTVYHMYIDWGADLIIGHHPHVIQGYEQYHKKYIYYSLGNFIFDMGQSDIKHRSLNLSVTIDETGLNIQRVYAEYHNGMVSLIDDEYDEELNELSGENLYGEAYEKAVDDFVLKVYLTYHDYYGKIRLLTGIYNRIFRHKRIYDQWLFHNLIIETHYYVMCRALKIKSRTGKL